jgi:CHAT domain-containing protein/tetratricopeptide (TPR) repeat protein
MFVPGSRVTHAGCAALAFVMFACTRDTGGEPATHYLAELPVAGDKPSVVELELAPGAFLVAVRERDTDLRLVLATADKYSEIEDDVPRHGLLAQVVRIGSPQKLRIELRNTGHRGSRGAAELRVARWRRGSVPDQRELGYAAFGAAGELTARNDKGSWARAAVLLQEATGYFAAAHDDAARAQAEYTLGHLEYLSRMDWDAAIRAADRARAAYATLGQYDGVHNAEMLRAVAELEVASGLGAEDQRAAQRALYAAADRSLAAAARYFGQRRLPLNEQYAVNMRGIRAYYQAHIEEAAAYFLRAAEMARDNRDPGEEARALSNLAWMNRRLGLLAQAAGEYERLIPLIEKDRQPDLYSAMLGNYGMCLAALGDFDRALVLHAEALQLSQNDDLEHARLLSALGGLYFRIGDMPRALETLDAAIVIQIRVGDAIGRAAALRMAGNAASGLGQHAVALRYLRASIEIDANTIGVARTRALVAAELRTLGDLRGAERELAQALESDNELARASALDQRGRLRLAQRRYREGIEDLRAADRRYAGLSLDFDRIETNSALSHALLAIRDVAGASAAADEAMAIERNIRLKSANPEWRANFLSSRYSPYEARIAVDFAANSGDPQQAAWLAFRTAELVRARSLADELAVAVRRSSASKQLIDDPYAKLAALQGHLESRMQRETVDAAEITRLRLAIEETRPQVDAARTGVAAGELALPAALAELRSLLPEDTAVLAYFVGDATSHAWLLARDELRHLEIAGRGRLMAAIAAASRELRDSRAPGRSTRSLAGTLLGDLLDGLHATRLLVLADGPLNGFPFAALTPPGGDAMLVDRFVLGYAPSLALALRPRQPPAAGAMRVAVVFDPVYTADDRRLARSGHRPADSRGTTDTPGLGRLSYSAVEARAVANAFDGAEVIELEGFDANARRVRDLPAQRLDVLHIASHAVTDRDTPEQSALFLSKYAADGSAIDADRLTAYDIRRSGLRADVVVLSGCATGDGRELRGEGVLGLAHAFLANGSHAVVVSLWPVEDAAAARFMAEFYSAYRTSHSASAALRLAQLRIRGSAPTATWSGFVIRAGALP